MVRALIVATALAATLPVALPVAPARAAPPGGVIASYFYSFAPGDRFEEIGGGGPPAVLASGTEAWFVNLDGAPHSVTAVTAAGDDPRFDSGVVLAPGGAPIRGTATLPPGDYPFICSVHPFLMSGTLRVIG